MKRFIILLAVLPCCLVGCSKEPPTLNDSFTVGFRTAYNDLDLSGELKHDFEGTSITLNEPYTVDGLCFDYAEEQLCVGYSSFETRAGSDYLPEGSLPSRVYDALLYLSQAQYTGSENDVDTFTVPTPQGEATITAAEGIPTGMTLPKSEIKLIFNSVKE